MVAKKKVKYYHLPEGDYSDSFIRYLAMAVHLNLIEPEQLTFWFESGKTISQINVYLQNKILNNKNTAG